MIVAVPLVWSDCKSRGVDGATTPQDMVSEPLDYASGGPK